MIPNLKGMLAQVEVRSAVAEDASEVARIYIDSWNEGFGELMPHRSLTSEIVERWRADLVKPAPHRWWVAQMRETIVGFVGIGPSRDPVEHELGELDTIAVDPRFWRYGVGSRLMSVAVGQLGADGYREGVLWTLAKYERGKRFYEAMGWRIDGGIRDEGRQIRYRYVLFT